MPDDRRFKWHVAFIVPKFRQYKSEKSPTLSRMIETMKERIRDVFENTRSVYEYSMILPVCDS